MVKKIVLADKIYNISTEQQKKDIFIRYNKYLNEKIKGFPKTHARISKLREFDKRFEVLIEGPETIFMVNLIKKEIGTIHKFEAVKVGQELKGIMVDVGKVGFGIFVDCAVLNPGADVLLNLHTLRDQLCKGNSVSLPEIIKGYDFIENFPVYVKIKEIDSENNKLEGELAKTTLNLFNKITKENIQGIFASGVTKNQLKKAIIGKGHLRDIMSIERYGFFENIVLLKEGTNAVGIISQIGRFLRNCKLSAIRSDKIKKLW